MRVFHHLLPLFIAAMPISTIQAQVINGDLNHNQGLDVEDVTLLIDGYLTGEAETISTTADPFIADNSLVVGTWYKSKNNSITFYEDGTTDYLADCTYKFKPYQGYIFFYNASGIPFASLRVPEVTADYLVVMPTGSDTPVIYTSTQPAEITLSETSVTLRPDEYTRLIATVSPADAGTVTWTSSDKDVATVVDGFVVAIADGTAIITAEVAGAKAYCEVTVESKILVDKITLSSTSLSFTLGGQGGSLTATVSPSDATDSSVSWTSSDPSVATVTSTGTIILQGVGVTTITCAANDGSGVEAMCTVTVTGTTGYNNGHEWVDLGLPSGVKWATMNIGAESPEDSGGYYAWGETSIKGFFDWSTYKYGTIDKYGSTDNLTKYNNIDGKKTLDPEDDPATQIWGGTWRMPTKEDWEELINNCQWEWITVNDIVGYKAMGPNSKTLFIPAAGYRWESGFQRKNEFGFYWTKDIGKPIYTGYCSLLFSTKIPELYSHERARGQSVRAVFE